MIKQIRSDQLKPGMFIHDLNCGWLDHPFFSNSFFVKNEVTVAKILELGIRALYIDTAKGADVKEGLPAQEVNAELDRQLQEISEKLVDKPVTVALADEAARARRLHVDANRVVRLVMEGVRSGEKMDVDRLKGMVDPLVESIFRNQDALLPLVRLKSQDGYTGEHAVGVCTLLAAFARTMKLPKDVVTDMALGGLLHDFGKAYVPDDILNKPAKLTDAEFGQMKLHVDHSVSLLELAGGVSKIALDVTAQHHERFDGTGYPHGLAGNKISLYGQMASIIDVYDAITSERVYHRGMSPTQGLKKLLEWSAHHFDPQLVQSFVRTLGIYPTGTLVRLESQRMGVVVQQNEGKLLEPTVRIFYHAGQQHYIPPELIDLAKVQDRIASFENYEKWKIDPYQWLPS